MNDATRLLWLSYGSHAIIKQFGAEGALALFAPSTARCVIPAGAVAKGKGTFAPPAKLPTPMQGESKQWQQPMPPATTPTGTGRGRSALSVPLEVNPDVLHFLRTSDESPYAGAHDARNVIPSNPPMARGRPSYGRQPFRTIADLLASCPTHEERLAIRRDFNIAYQPGVPLGPWGCSVGGAESSIELTVYNAFRAMRLIQFDAPIPVLGATNLYEWLFGEQLTQILVTAGEAYSSAHGGMMRIRSEVLGQLSQREWVNFSSGTGLLDIVTLLVHEGRHATGGPGHDCSINGAARDSTLEYGGSWAVQYWLYRWLAEHSGSYLSARDRQYAAELAEYILSSGFCSSR